MVNSHNTNASNETHIGQIVVNTGATDASGIVRDIKPVLERAHFAYNANYSVGLIGATNGRRYLSVPAQGMVAHSAKDRPLARTLGDRAPLAREEVGTISSEDRDARADAIGHVKVI